MPSAAARPALLQTSTKRHGDLCFCDGVGSDTNPWLLLDAIRDCLVIVDDAGVVRWSNAAWRRLDARECGRIGADYAAACACFFEPRCPEVEELTRGVREILSGRSQELELRCPYVVATGRRWLSIVARPCDVA